jgi:hypothetical protein
VEQEQPGQALVVDCLWAQPSTTYISTTELSSLGARHAPAASSSLALATAAPSAPAGVGEMAARSDALRGLLAQLQSLGADLAATRAELAAGREERLAVRAELGDLRDQVGGGAGARCAAQRARCLVLCDWRGRRRSLGGGGEARGGGWPAASGHTAAR